jgi:ParB family transcriptional regulator, chromosome partitioning protein
VIRTVDDRTLLVLALVENLQRSELSALEEAEGFQQLMKEFGLSQQAVADAVGRDRSTVANTLRLLQLPISIRRLLQAGTLTAGHARALLGAADPIKMADLARQAADQQWSVRETEERVRTAAMGGRKQPRARRSDPAARALEEELERTLGTQVRIQRGRGGVKGRIEVSFYDADDFERVFELLAGKPAVEVVS